MRSFVLVTLLFATAYRVGCDCGGGPDGGPALPDGGDPSLESDGGPVNPDGGSSTPDGGSPNGDGGVLLPDGGTPTELCDNFFDDDADGFTDCRDPDCLNQFCDDKNPCNVFERCDVNGKCSGGSTNTQGQLCELDICHGQGTCQNGVCQVIPNPNCPANYVCCPSATNGCCDATNPATCPC